MLQRRDKCFVLFILCTCVEIKKKAVWQLIFNMDMIDKIKDSEKSLCDVPGVKTHHDLMSSSCSCWFEKQIDNKVKVNFFRDIL